MCELGHLHSDAADEPFGFLVDRPEIRALIEETTRLTREIPDAGQRVEALRPAFASLLAADSWLPEECAVPDEKSRMGGGIGQYALFRAHGRDPARAQLVVAKRQQLGPGEFYVLLPPTDDIHYVSTISETQSVSIHLLANDTACVWRHKFDPASGLVTPFRSGYANAPCPPDQA
jgi:predicted metal-dependent enzyme (double-stranded beta helix superfamily)